MCSQMQTHWPSDTLVWSLHPLHLPSKLACFAEHPHLKQTPLHECSSTICSQEWCVTLYLFKVAKICFHACSACNCKFPPQVPDERTHKALSQARAHNVHQMIICYNRCMLQAAACAMDSTRHAMLASLYAQDNNTLCTCVSLLVMLMLVGIGLANTSNATSYPSVQSGQTALLDAILRI